MADDWRNKFLPEFDKKELDDVIDDTVSDLASELGTEDKILSQFGVEVPDVDVETRDYYESVVANLLEEGVEAQLAILSIASMILC